MHSPVLVVEDDADVRSLLVETLADVGGFLVYAVETAGGAQALVAECGDSFAAVVLDIGLPDGDGREFCASLRRQGFHLPVILLSGLGGEDNVVCGFEAGADDYLVKPFSTAELLARIDAQLRRAAPQIRPTPVRPEFAAETVSPELAGHRTAQAAAGVCMAQQLSLERLSSDVSKTPSV